VYITVQHGQWSGFFFTVDNCYELLQLEPGMLHIYIACYMHVTNFKLGVCLRSTPCTSLILQSTIKNQNPEDPLLLSPENPQQYSCGWQKPTMPHLQNPKLTCRVYPNCYFYYNFELLQMCRVQNCNC
jgi:hypothetical protein